MPIVSGILNYEGQKQANATNLQIARETNEFNAAEAEKTRAFNSAEAQRQRDWEKEMSDTAIQRQAADYKAAGLNPYLAVTGGSAGGASTPSGTAASAGSASGVAAHVQNVRAGEIASGLQSLANSAMSIYTINKVAKAVGAGNLAAAVKTAKSAGVVKALLKFLL